MTSRETFVGRTLPVVCVLMLAAATPMAVAADSSGSQQLIQALSRTKHTLMDGVRQASASNGAPISAKFELEDGKLSLSIYTAGKGISVPAEQNVLQELAGSPEQEKWTPEVEVFKDTPHIARSSEQLTIISLGKASLSDLIARAQKAHPGTVFSITPVIRNHKPAVEVLVVEKGKVKTVLQPL